MPDNTKKNTPINYLNREFSGIRNDLIELAERFYPTQFQDFSEGSFGAMMVDAVAYVGDQLSLYLDYNVNEAFLDTSFDRNNILRHGAALGYKNRGRSSTYGTVALFVMVPAEVGGLGPDTAYIPILPKGARLSSTAGIGFILTDDVDFSEPKNDVVVARVNASTGAPTYYAIKAYGNVVSGQLAFRRVTVGAYQRFLKVKIANEEIAEVISVFDAEGNEFFEVDYLAQDMVYKELKNDNFQADNIPSIIKPLLVSRKFIMDTGPRGTFLQFGSGDPGATNVVANPQSVAVNTFGKSYITDTTFDPTRLTKNHSFGIVPANTTLLISYRIIQPLNGNLGVGAINGVGSSTLQFKDRNSLSTALITGVQNSLEASNETPIVGDVSSISVGQLKQQILDTFPTQNRAVTQADYENLALRMPPRLGSIKRVSTQKDQDSLKRNLNLYVVSEDQFGKLTRTNQTIKNNLKTWLSTHRMINDTVDILDPYIINLGVDFVISASPGVDKNTALNAAMTKIRQRFAEGFFIGEKLYISDVYSTLKETMGVLDVVKVKINNKTGARYSSVAYNINKNLSPDGSYLMAPMNGVFEIKFPITDIKGKIR